MRFLTSHLFFTRGPNWSPWFTP